MIQRIAKPYDGFPLTPHYGSGQWCKKIKGRLFYFGKLEDWRAALNTWLEDRDDLMAGRQPRGNRDDAEATVATLVEHFLEAKKLLVDTGEIQERTYKEYEVTCERIKKSVGDWRVLTDLNIRDFNKLRADFAKERGPTSLKTELTRARSVFLYANESGLAERPLAYRKPLRSPSKSAFTRLKAEQGARMFTAKQIKTLIAAATPQMKAMIYLGINCGFGNGDISAIKWDHVDLQHAMHTFARPKTGNARRCPLWKETVAALKAIQTTRDLVFLTKYKQAWSSPAIGQEFKKLLEECKLYTPGNTFYSLRRTFETIAAATGEQVAVDHIMGHLSPTMASVYRQRVFTEPLTRVTNYVREWLQGRVKLDFGDVKGSSVAAGTRR